MSFTIRVLGEPPSSAPAREGETILDSLLEAGIAFPHDCRAGNCASCKCELVEGDVLDLPHSEYALTPEERGRNLILACRAQVWSPCVIRPLAADEVVLHPSRIMRCRVEALELLTHDIRLLRLSISAGGPFTFTPGQYAKLQLAPGLAERSYSMANAPADPQLEFHIRRVPGGQATTHLFETLAVGDTVRVSGPFGTAHLRERHRGPVVAVAGGSGLAPIKAIVEGALAEAPGRPVHLYFGVRDERDVYLEEHFRALAGRHPNLRFHVVLSAPSATTSRRTGLVGDAVAADRLELDGAKAYLAGPPPMVEGLQAQLLARGLPGRDVHADPFFSQADTKP